ncbi:C-Myc-binding protein [Cyphomyrmex costatus]|uniref:c-Myc-binding protein n=1 Tax=Cyphomyrmex costatus TaxID=456900 RepID=A0A195CMC1_9HYME|nr:C-Myc-binding protein [Cyphomyrmex costatus]
MLFRLRAIDFRERTTINIHVRPPTVACVALSNAARADSFLSLLSHFNPTSPIIEQTPIAHSVTAKREEFRKYLERSGVMDALTKILVLLYDETEKPSDALEYIRKNLGGIVDNTSEIDSLKKELEESKAKIAELQSKLAKYELTDEAKAE